MWGGGRSSLPLPLPLPRTRNAIFPPTHHSPLGGQSLAKLSTKIKLRCRFLPIALNRADWIRISLFSSHLDHLVDGGPREGWDQVGEGQRLGKTSQHFSALEPEGEGMGYHPHPYPLSQGQVHSLSLHSAVQAGPG